MSIKVTATQQVTRVEVKGQQGIRVTPQHQVTRVRVLEQGELRATLKVSSVRVRVSTVDTRVQVNAQTTRVNVRETLAIRNVVGGGGSGASSSVVWDPASAYGTPDELTSFAGFADAFAAFMALPPGGDFVFASNGTVPAGTWDFQNRAASVGGLRFRSPTITFDNAARFGNVNRLQNISVTLAFGTGQDSILYGTGGDVLTIDSCLFFGFLPTLRAIVRRTDAEQMNQVVLRDSLIFTIPTGITVFESQGSNAMTFWVDNTEGLTQGNFESSATSGAGQFIYMSAGVRTDDSSRSAEAPDFAKYALTPTVLRNTAVSAFVNDAGYLTGAEWGTLAQTWSTRPTIQPYSGGGGRVFRYDYPGPATLYRFVPTPYDASLDAFYTTFVDPTLSGVVAVRATAPNL